MSWMSSLNRWDELTVPNWPLESMTTGMASFLPVVTARIPTAKNEVWPAGLPMRIVLLSLGNPSVPMVMLLLPVMIALPAPILTAMLLFPVVLMPRAETPIAVLPFPVMLESKAVRPMAVFSRPLVLCESAFSPLAVLLWPVVLHDSAWSPFAVL